MSQDTQRILERVKKLLTLANDAGASEGERDNAMRMAFNTLAKYNLDIADVEALKNDQGDPRIKHEFEAFFATYWEAAIAKAIGNLFFCKYYRFGYQRHAFVGKTVNVHTATYLTEFACKAIKQEADKAAKLHVGDVKLANLFQKADAEVECGKAKWIESFCIGAAEKVQERCASMLKQAQQNNSQGTGTSLVLASHYKREMDANNQLLKDMGITLGHGRAPSITTAEGARMSGNAYGNRVSLNQQVGTSSATPRLGKSNG